MNEFARSVLAIVAAAVSLCACDGSVYTPATAVITKMYDEESVMGCIGTNTNTIVRLSDGRLARLCGRWGEIGESISGCWVSNAEWHGFQPNCPYPPRTIPEKP